MASVRLESITQQFDRVLAVEDISFEVPDGQFWVLVGPSGCGKSTLLRLIAGLEPIDRGTLYIGEQIANAIPARQRDVAMVFQNYALYPHMTVAQNLAFGLRMRKAVPTAIQSRVDAIARSLDITHLLDRKPRQLSGGQQQRVALGRAIAREPKVFLLDEPLSNLDAQLRDDTRAELKQLHQRLGITTLYVTHDQVEAMTLADRMVVLNRGRIQQIGTPQEVYAKPANRMVATFLGAPPMNILSAVCREGRFQIDRDQFLPMSSDLLTKLSLDEGQRIDLGIRPEHLRLVTAEEAAQFTVTASVVEPLGRETLIRTVLPNGDIERPESTINVQTVPTVQPQPGDTLPLIAERDRIFVFDPATGQRIYPLG